MSGLELGLIVLVSVFTLVGSFLVGLSVVRWYKLRGRNK